MLKLTRDQVRRVDQLATDELGIPSLLLMENAARNAADHAVAMLQAAGLDPEGAAVAVVCGGGNNGGDGYAIARHLHIRGARVAVDAVVDPQKLKGDAAVNHQIVRRMGLPITHLLDEEGINAAGRRWDAASILVDAILGTGFSGSVRKPLDAVIRRCNQARSGGTRILAVDVPSGLDCETGNPSPTTIEADLTVTFAAYKTTFDAPAARRFLGRIVVADIGAPPELIDRVVRM